MAKASRGSGSARMLTLTPLLFALGCCLPAIEAPPDLRPTRPLTRLEQAFLATDYALLYRRRELPAALAGRFAGIADPGEPYNSSDCIDPRLPMARLVFAGVADETAFVLTEGMMMVRGLILFELRDGRIVTESRYTIRHHVTDIVALETAMRTRDWWDEPERE